LSRMVDGPASDLWAVFPTVGRAEREGPRIVQSERPYRLLSATRCRIQSDQFIRDRSGRGSVAHAVERLQGDQMWLTPDHPQLFRAVTKALSCSMPEETGRLADVISVPKSRRRFTGEEVFCAPLSNPLVRGCRVDHD